MTAINSTLTALIYPKMLLKYIRVCPQFSNVLMVLTKKLWKRRFESYCWGRKNGPLSCFVDDMMITELTKFSMITLFLSASTSTFMYSRRWRCTISYYKKVYIYIYIYIYMYIYIFIWYSISYYIILTLVFLSSLSSILS